MEYLLKGGGSDVFNVGTGQGKSVKEVLEAVERVTGKKPAAHDWTAARRRPAQSGLQIPLKLQTKLGWKPKRADLDRIVGDAWTFAQRG